MEDKELITNIEETKQALEEQPHFDKMFVLSIVCLCVALTATAILAYKQGVKDTEKLFKEPSLHLTLVPTEGALQVIPIKLTPKGVGLRFNTPVTNLMSIGIDFADKK